MELYMGVFSNDPLFAAPRTVAHQAPLSMEFSSQEYWSGLPFPSPGDLPDAGIKLASLALASRFFPIWATREACLWSCRFFNRCSRVPLDSGKATCTLATQTTPSLVPRAAKRQTWGGRPLATIANLCGTKPAVWGSARSWKDLLISTHRCLPSVLPYPRLHSARNLALSIGVLG